MDHFKAAGEVSDTTTCFDLNPVLTPVCEETNIVNLGSCRAKAGRCLDEVRACLFANEQCIQFLRLIQVAGLHDDFCP